MRNAPSKLKPEPLEMVFIRAPIIEEVGPDVEVLASDPGHPVLVRHGRLLMATFHPELTERHHGARIFSEARRGESASRALRRVEAASHRSAGPRSLP